MTRCQSGDKEEGIYSGADILKDKHNSYQNNGIDNQHEFSMVREVYLLKMRARMSVPSCSSTGIEDDP